MKHMLFVAYIKYYFNNNLVRKERFCKAPLFRIATCVSRGSFSTQTFLLRVQVLSIFPVYVGFNQY